MILAAWKEPEFGSSKPPPLSDPKTWVPHTEARAMKTSAPAMTHRRRWWTKRPRESNMALLPE